MAVERAQALSQTPYTLPASPVAPLQPMQTQAFDQTQAIQGMAQPYFNAGTNLVAQGANPDIGQYFGAEAAGVMPQLSNIFGQQMAQVTGNGVQAAGGIGADRVGVAQAETANQQGLAAGQTLSQLFGQSVNQAQAGAGLEQQAGMNLGQLGAGAQQAALQGTQAEMVAGTLQQQQLQNQQNAQYQQLQNEFAYPFQANQYLESAVSGVTPAMGGSGVMTTNSKGSSINPMQGLSQGAGLMGMMKGLQTGGRVKKPEWADGADLEDDESAYAPGGAVLGKLIGQAGPAAMQGLGAAGAGLSGLAGSAISIPAEMHASGGPALGDPGRNPDDVAFRAHIQNPSSGWDQEYRWPTPRIPPETGMPINPGQRISFPDQGGDVRQLAAGGRPKALGVGGESGNFTPATGQTVSIPYGPHFGGPQTFTVGDNGPSGLSGTPQLQIPPNYFSSKPEMEPAQGQTPDFGNPLLSQLMGERDGLMARLDGHTSQGPMSFGLHWPQMKAGGAARYDFGGSTPKPPPSDDAFQSPFGSQVSYNGVGTGVPKLGQKNVIPNLPAIGRPSPAMPAMMQAMQQANAQGIQQAQGSGGGGGGPPGQGGNVGTETQSQEAQHSTPTPITPDTSLLPNVETGGRIGYDAGGGTKGSMPSQLPVMEGPRPWELPSRTWMNSPVGNGPHPTPPPLVTPVQPSQTQPQQDNVGKAAQPQHSGSLTIPSAIQPAINAGAKAAGLDPNTFAAMAHIESGFDPNSNRNKSTQYKGLFQLNRQDMAGRGNVYDPMDNAMAMANLINRNRATFTAMKGREPTPTELYMMHQQGPGFYKRGTMTNIAGNPYPGMRGPQTPQSFEKGWGDALANRIARLGGDAGTMLAQNDSAAPATAPPPTNSANASLTPANGSAMPGPPQSPVTTLPSAPPTQDASLQPSATNYGLVNDGTDLTGLPKPPPAPMPKPGASSMNGEPSPVEDKSQPGDDEVVKSQDPEDALARMPSIAKKGGRIQHLDEGGSPAGDYSQTQPDQSGSMPLMANMMPPGMLPSGGSFSPEGSIANQFRYGIESQAYGQPTGQSAQQAGMPPQTPSFPTENPAGVQSSAPQVPPSVTQGQPQPTPPQQGNVPAAPPQGGGLGVIAPTNAYQAVYQALRPLFSTLSEKPPTADQEHQEQVNNLSRMAGNPPTTGQKQEAARRIAGTLANQGEPTVGGRINRLLGPIARGIANSQTGNPLDATEAPVGSTDYKPTGPTPIGKGEGITPAPSSTSAPGKAGIDNSPPASSPPVTPSRPDTGAARPPGVNSPPPAATLTPQQKQFRTIVDSVRNQSIVKAIAGRPEAKGYSPGQITYGVESWGIKPETTVEQLLRSGEWQKIPPQYRQGLIPDGWGQNEINQALDAGQKPIQVADNSGTTVPSGQTPQQSAAPAQAAPSQNAGPGRLSPGGSYTSWMKGLARKDPALWWLMTSDVLAGRSPATSIAAMRAGMNLDAAARTQYADLSPQAAGAALGSEAQAAANFTKASDDAQAHYAGQAAGAGIGGGGGGPGMGGGSGRYARDVHGALNAAALTPEARANPAVAEEVARAHLALSSGNPEQIQAGNAMLNGMASRGLISAQTQQALMEAASKRYLPMGPYGYLDLKTGQPLAFEDIANQFGRGQNQTPTASQPVHPQTAPASAPLTPGGESPPPTNMTASNAPVAIPGMGGPAPSANDLPALNWGAALTQPQQQAQVPQQMPQVSQVSPQQQPEQIFQAMPQVFGNAPEPDRVFDPGLFNGNQALSAQTNDRVQKEIMPYIQQAYKSDHARMLIADLENTINRIPPGDRNVWAASKFKIANQWNALMDSIGAGKEAHIDAEKFGAMEAAEGAMFQIARSLMGNMGSRGSAGRFLDRAMATIPHVATSPEGARVMFASIKSTLDYDHDMGAFAQKWLDTNRSAQGFGAAVNKHIADGSLNPETYAMRAQLYAAHDAKGNPINGDMINRLLRNPQTAPQFSKYWNAPGLGEWIVQRAGAQ